MSVRLLQGGQFCHLFCDFLNNPLRISLRIIVSHFFKRFFVLFFIFFVEKGFDDIHQSAKMFDDQKESFFRIVPQTSLFPSLCEISKHKFKFTVKSRERF